MQHKTKLTKNLPIFVYRLRAVKESNEYNVDTSLYNYCMNLLDLNIRVLGDSLHTTALPFFKYVT